MLLSKPLIISLIFSMILSLFSGYLLIERKKYSVEIEQKITSIQNLEKEVDQERKRTKDALTLLESLSDVQSDVRDKIEKQREDKHKSLKRIEDVIKDEDVVDIMLDSRITSMLNEICDRIRGNTCPTP